MILGADSIDRIELITRLEEEFNIEITREEALQVMTVDQAFMLLLPKLSSASSPLGKAQKRMRNPVHCARWAPARR